MYDDDEDTTDDEERISDESIRYFAGRVEGLEAFAIAVIAASLQSGGLQRYFIMRVAAVSDRQYSNDWSDEFRKGFDDVTQCLRETLEKTRAISESGIKSMTADEKNSYVEGKVWGVMQFTVAASVGTDPANLDRCKEVAKNAHAYSRRYEQVSEHFRSGACDSLENIQLYIQTLEAGIKTNPEFRTPELLVQSLTPRPTNVVRSKRARPAKQADKE